MPDVKSKYRCIFVLDRMSENTLNIQFRANAPDENLTLDDFCKQVADFNTALSGLDQHISSRKKSTVLYRLVDLKHSSPAQMTIEATGLEDSLEDNSAKIFPAFIRTIETLNARKGYQDLPRSVLEPIYRIAKSVSGSIKEIRITAETSTVFVTDRIATLLADYLEKEKIAVGSVRGVIEIINLHAGTNTFRIYPVIGASYINCWFPKELKEKAKEAVDNYVRVSGKLHYLTGCEHPYKIEVDQIETMPEESTLPLLGSFKGVLAADKSTEALLEEERNGQWQ
jgi:hypothetical protein